jgi:hypothetical protein
MRLLIPLACQIWAGILTGLLINGNIDMFRIETTPSDVYGVSPNYFDIGSPEFTIVSSSDPSLNSALSLGEHLYTVKGFISAIMGNSLI